MTYGICSLVLVASFSIMSLVLPFVDTIMREYYGYIESRLDICRLQVLPSYFLGIQLVMASVAGYVGVRTMSWFVSLLAGVLGCLLPLVLLHLSIVRRRGVFALQVAGALTLWSSGLSAGFSVLQGAELVAQEIKPPLGSEFSRMVSEVRLGIPLHASLARVGHRMCNDDINMVNTAAAIQLDLGGDLSEIMERLCEDIRERSRIQGQLRTVTAQGKLTGLVIVLIPAGLYFIMSLLEPGFFDPLFTAPIGKVLLCVGCFLECLGVVTMLRICRIEV